MSGSSQWIACGTFSLVQVPEVLAGPPFFAVILIPLDSIISFWAKAVSVPIYVKIIITNT